MPRAYDVRSFNLSVGLTSTRTALRRLLNSSTSPTVTTFESARAVRFSSRYSVDKTSKIVSCVISPVSPCCTNCSTTDSPSRSKVSGTFKLRLVVIFNRHKPEGSAEYYFSSLRCLSASFMEDNASSHWLEPIVLRLVIFPGFSPSKSFSLPLISNA